VLSSAKIGRSSWRYHSRTVAGGACEYDAEHGDAPGRWHGAGLSELGLTAGARVEERELEALFGRALSPTTGVVLGSAWRADAVTGSDLTSVSTLRALGDAGTMGVAGAGLSVLPPAVVAKQLSHRRASLAMDVYAHLLVDDSAVLAALVSGLVSGLVSNQGDPK
jgi:hypothetical protein